MPYLGPYVEPGATWTDAVDGSGNAILGGDTVDVTTPGDYTVTYNYTDSAGNPAAEVTRIVTVLPWSTINVTKDIRNWKDDDTNEPDEFIIQLNGTDDKVLSESISVTYDKLPPGTYTITELAHDKYVLNEIVGDDDTDPSNGVTITLGSGETVNLEFINWMYLENREKNKPDNPGNGRGNN